VSALDHAVGAGELSSKGAELDKVLRENRGEILDWIREQKAEASLLETARFKTILGWTITAAVASVIAAIDARTNGIPPIPETFSEEAKETLAKLWGEYTRLDIVDRQTRGPDIRKTLALIEEILARIPPDAEL
jgi:hypothetical protein